MPVIARGWCNAHYKRRWRAAGSFSRPTASERFLAQVNKDGPVARNAPELGRCWLWTGALTGGYGRFRAGGVKVFAHRWSYERDIGPVPNGLVLDHFACDNPPCVNPEHVRPATQRENTLRSDIGVTAVNSRKTHCLRGHEFTPENTHVIPTGRSCRECERIRGSRAARAQRQAEKLRTGDAP